MTDCAHEDFRLSCPDCTFRFFFATCNDCGADLGEYDLVNKEFVKK